jgi:SEC-C motif domain protein
MMCPCCSGKNYTECCAPYHLGKEPPNALALMRSRYSAYAKGNAEYIIRTTHRKNPYYLRDTELWKKEIQMFCRQTKFTGLDILSFEDEKDIAYVTFTAHLEQNNQDVSFSEKSLFEKVDNHWRYLKKI